MPTDSINLKGHFLISMPHMSDPYFAHSLIYVCSHDDDGAMGLIINRSTPLDLHDLLAHLQLPHPESTRLEPVYFGGPVQPERGFILHPADSGRWTGTLDVDNIACMTSSVDILQAIANNEGPTQKVVALGYAGWGGGQLEQEMSENAWLSCPANSDIMFRTPVEERLNAAAALLGINLDLLSADTGHA